VAKGHGIVPFGVLGVLLEAKHRGLIARVTPLVEILRTRDYRLSDALVTAVLRQAGEDEK
jgi:predicted nucleic acid-binding protein